MRASRRPSSRPAPGSRRPRSYRRCSRLSLVTAAPASGTRRIILEAQRPAHRIPELPAPALVLRRLVLDLAQLLQHLALLGAELVGRPDVHADVQVAMAALAQARQALGAQPVGHAGLRPRLDPQRALAIRGRHVHLGAERGLRECDAEVVDQIVAVALEAGIVLDIEHGNEIAARAVAWAGHTLAAQREIVMIRDARRHVDLNRLLAPHAPIAAAALARIVDDRAFAGAGRARRHRQELPEQRLRVAPHLAAAAARAAGHRLRTGRRAGAGADRAWLETLDADRLGRAGCHL